MILSDEESIIYNEGERLLPGITHSVEELIRHQSSYAFFKAVIETDLKRSGQYGKTTVTIADFGFGVGHGCKTLSSIPGAQVIGVDVSVECKAYADRFYHAPNITYCVSDIIEYVESMPTFDYVVSRGVVEHVINGIEVMKSAKWKNRMMIDLPYNEPEDINHHHVVSNVTAKDFSDYPNAEIFYEEVSGEIYTGEVKDPIPNMIMCAARSDSLPEIKSIVEFPFPAWVPSKPKVRQPWLSKIKHFIFAD